MNALVSYASSDSEAESERPAKITKTEALAARSRADNATHSDVSMEGGSERRAREEEDSNELPSRPSQTAQGTAPIGPSIPESMTTAASNTTNLEAEAPSRVAAPAPAPETTTPTSAPQSPYSTTRAALHDLTLPTHPNFSIPESPSPPSSPNTLAAHAAATKKFAKFLELKHQQHDYKNEGRRRDGGRGPAPMHFHERLLASSALRNPGMVDRLMEFAGVGVEERYAGTLPVGVAGGDTDAGNEKDGEEYDRGGVPVRWGEGWYVENLLQEAERRRKKTERKKGEDVQFVASGTGGIDGSNNAELDSGGGRGNAVMSEHGQPRAAKKSRFDER